MSRRSIPESEVAMYKMSLAIAKSAIESPERKSLVSHTVFLSIVIGFAEPEAEMLYSMA